MVPLVGDAARPLSSPEVLSDRSDSGCGNNRFIAAVRWRVFRVPADAEGDEVCVSPGRTATDWSPTVT
ncbi:hypothetical protein CKY47_14885 [Saccharothrix yanglingensis]|uniref:Uncharacterized protein n=1 Tax=Saccharothrix yanglingensis TaxID=659496 RepID=A0ABU0X3T3_9PSEU|nr:hypothetical protein [Saccharothrix yanglingensis]